MEAKHHAPSKILGKKVLTDYEAEGSALLLHVAGEDMPQHVRDHYWKTWYELHLRSYGLHGIDPVEAKGRRHHLFEKYANSGDDRATVMEG